MDFKHRLDRLVQTGESPAAAPPQDQIKAGLDRLSKAMGEAFAVLRNAKDSIPGSEATPPGRDATDPSFYVSSLQIPKATEIGFTHPIRLYFVGFPVFTPIFGLRMVRAVALGAATQMMSLRSFLQAWHQAGAGGVVVYEGDPDPARTRTACEQAILRFFERRAELTASRDLGKAGQVQVWPLDPNFKPRLCSQCLLPLPPTSGCLRCGKRPG